MIKNKTYIRKASNYTLYVAFFVFYLLLLRTLVYFERQDDTHMLDDMYDAIWYSLVTITTVGYGDIVPVTEAGRLISLVFILSGLTLWCLLIGAVLSVSNGIKEKRKLGLYGTKMKNHVVIIGWNDFGKNVADQLTKAGRKIAIVTSERENVDLIKERYINHSVFVVYTDLDNYDTIKKSNIEEASTVFINLDEDSKKLVYLLNLRKHFGEKQYVVNIENGDLKSTFEAAGALYVISKNELSSKLLASYIFEPDVAKLSEELITYATKEDEFDIKQYAISKGNPFEDMEYTKAFFELKSTYNGVLLGIVRKDENNINKIHKNPEGNFIIKEDDFMIMVLNHASMRKIQKVFGIKEGVHG